MSTATAEPLAAPAGVTPSASVAVATIPQKTPITFGDLGIQIRTLEDAFRFATLVVKSGLAPKGIDTPEAVVIAIQHGAELGLSPLMSLQSIATINGRPGVYGDTALALVRKSGLLEIYSQKVDGDKATVTVKRRDEAEMTSTFSVDDAKKAGLWGKAGPWTQYPSRMLLFRARGFALRDAFGDVLRGLRTVEELQDIPAEPRNVTPTAGLAAAVDGEAQPANAEVAA